MTRQRFRRQVVEGKPIVLWVHDVRTERAEQKTAECVLGADTARCMVFSFVGQRAAGQELLSTTR